MKTSKHVTRLEFTALAPKSMSSHQNLRTHVFTTEETGQLRFKVKITLLLLCDVDSIAYDEYAPTGQSTIMSRYLSILMRLHNAVK